jgi:endonuclease V
MTTLQSLVCNRDELDFLGCDLTNYHNTQPNNNSTTFIIDTEAIMSNSTQIVTSITIMDHKHNVVLDTLIHPNVHVTDYITHITGFTEETFKNVTTKLDDVVQFIKKTIKPNDIIAGHGIIGDLKLLGFDHYNVIDTQLLFTHPDGPPHYYSLKYLAQKYGKMIIQQKTHNAKEDVEAVYKLLIFFTGNSFHKPVYRELNKQIDNPDFQCIIDAVQIDPSFVLAVYLRGSRGIGTQGLRNNNKPSDWDFILIIDDEYHVLSDTLIKYGNMDINMYNFTEFKKMLYDQVIWALEAIYVPDCNIMQNKINFRRIMHEFYGSTPSEIWLPYLKSSVGEQTSKKRSSSYRFYTEGAFYKSKKHLFIAFRFLYYGIDIINNHCIDDCTKFNYIWKELYYCNSTTENVNPNNQYNYEEYKKKYDILYHTFRKMTPKLTRHGGFREEIKIKYYYNYKAQFIPIVSTMTCALDSLQDNCVSKYFRNLVNEKSLDSNEVIKYMYTTFQIMGKRIQQNNNLIQFKYTYETPIDNFTNQFNNIIIDSNTWNVIAYPFPRFFNYGDTNAPNLDVTTIKSQEMYDGIQVIMYFYNNNWNVAFDCTETHNEKKFESLFFEVWYDKKYNVNANMNTNTCYVFELIHKNYIIITRYHQNDIIFIAARNMKTFNEENVNHIVQKNNWSCKCVGQNNIQCSVDQYVELIKNNKDKLKKGAVLIDQHYNRIKIKTEQYLEMSYIVPLQVTWLREISQLKFVKIVQMGRQDEFKLYFHQHAEAIDSITNKVNQYITTAKSIHEKIKNAQEQKKYVQLVYKETNNVLIANILFAMKNHNQTPINYLSCVGIKSFTKYLTGIYNPTRNNQHQKKKNTNIPTNANNMITYHIDEVIEIGDPNMHMDQYLAMWDREQNIISSQLNFNSTFDIDKIKYVGGTDISFDKNNSSYAIACIVIHDLKTKQLVGRFTMNCIIHIPYKATYLSYREAPALIKLHDYIKKHYSEIAPDLFILDGSGIWHPRRCGLATYFSHKTGIPSFGVAKNFLHIDNWTKSDIETNIKQYAPNQGDIFRVHGKDGVLIGAVINATGSVKSVVYVSVGNNMTLDHAISILSQMSKYRVNEAVRQADLFSRELLRRM